MTETLDIQALVDAGLIADPKATVAYPEVRIAAKTDMGMVREYNEDKFEFYEPEDPEILKLRGSLYAVADGMGGAAAGQIASEQTLHMLIEAYYNYYNIGTVEGEPIDVELALTSAVRVANGIVRSYTNQRPDWSGMGATLTCVVLVRNQAFVAQVGDSRGYLIRDGRIRQVTQDHSWVEEQVRSGLLSRQEAEDSPYRNVITRSIGTLATVEPDVFVEFVRTGDIWVLCTDGLTAYIADDEIRHWCLELAPAEAVRKLIQMAKDRGGRDNITAMVLTVRDMLPLVV